MVPFFSLMQIALILPVFMLASYLIHIAAVPLPLFNS